MSALELWTVEASFFSHGRVDHRKLNKMPLFLGGVY